MKSHQSIISALLIVGAITLLAPSTIQAQPNGALAHKTFGDNAPPPPNAGDSGPMPPFLHNIELSEAQQDKVFSIMHAQAPLIREQVKIIRKTHETLQSLAKADRFDDAKVKAIAETSAHAMVELAMLRTRSDHQIYALLTPEQRKQADDMKARFHSPIFPMGKNMPPAANRYKPLT